MGIKVVGCVVTKVNKDQIEVKEIQLGETAQISTTEAKAYSPGDLVTIDSETKTLVDCMEDYPFV